MLDQNTDRMWYVIGAVIVGAAIIMIMNGTFPKLFASVGETFKDKTEEVTEVTDGIMPVGRDLLTNIELVEGILRPTGHVDIGLDGRHVYTKSFIDVSEYSELTLVLHDNRIPGSLNWSGRIVFYTSDGLVITNIDTGDWTTPHQATYDIPKDTATVRLLLLDGDVVEYSLYGGK